MTTTTTTPATTPSPDCDGRFGLCPECRRTDGYMNVGACHWFVCDAHMTKWPGGYGMFSCWQQEDENLWRRNAERLKGYRQVDPA